MFIFLEHPSLLNSIQLFPETNWTGKFSREKAKKTKCACSRHHFPVPVLAAKGGFPLVLFASGTGKEIINKRDWLFS